MEVMFKVSVPDGYDVFWEGFLGYLQEVAPDYDNDANFSISGPLLSAEEQNDVFDWVCGLLNYMPSHHIHFGCIYNKVHCSLIPVKPAKLDEAAIGIRPKTPRCRSGACRGCGRNGESVGLGFLILGVGCLRCVYLGYCSCQRCRIIGGYILIHLIFGVDYCFAIYRLSGNGGRNRPLEVHEVIVVGGNDRLLPSLRGNHDLRASVVIIDFEGNRIIMARDDVMTVIVVDTVTRHYGYSGLNDSIILFNN